MSSENKSKCEKCGSFYEYGVLRCKRCGAPQERMCDHRCDHYVTKEKRVGPWPFAYVRENTCHFKLNRTCMPPYHQNFSLRKV